MVGIILDIVLLAIVVFCACAFGAAYLGMKRDRQDLLCDPNELFFLAQFGMRNALIFALMYAGAVVLSLIRDLLANG